MAEGTKVEPRICMVRTSLTHGDAHENPKPDVCLGRAFFGISGPGLVKKDFFETFRSTKIDGRWRG